VKNALKHVGRAMAGVLPAALFVRLGLPVIVALVFLAVLVLGATCWVINNGDRSDRVTRMILARHGDTRCLATGSPATSSPSSRPRRRRRPGAAG
jgi:hypothetical protein